jgi:hypothetical protein
MTSRSSLNEHCDGYPMLNGSVCIARKTMAKMNTLQTVAPIPAFVVSSTPCLRR